MKADPGAQQRLLAVQDIDTQIQQALHRRSHLPEVAELQGVQSKGRQLQEELIAADTRLADATRAQARAEADLVPVRERRQRDQERVDAGQGDPKSLQAMIDEIAHLGRRIKDLEDAEIQAMEEVEEATRRRDELRASLLDLKRQHTDLLGSRDGKLAELDERLAALRADRDGLLPELPAELVALYERIAAKSGAGAARLVGRRCSGCGIEANSADMRRYEAATSDEVLRCEECARILVRTA